MATRTRPAREAGTAPATPAATLGRRSLASVADQLQVNFIKAVDLAKLKSFTLLNAATRSRVMNGKASEEVAFELVDDATGEVFFYTPQANATRQRWIDVLKGGPVGPLTLIEGEGKAGLNAPWIFADEKRKPVF